MVKEVPSIHPRGLCIEMKVEREPENDAVIKHKCSTSLQGSTLKVMHIIA